MVKSVSYPSEGSLVPFRRPRRLGWHGWNPEPRTWVQTTADAPPRTALPRASVEKGWHKLAWNCCSDRRLYCACNLHPKETLAKGATCLLLGFWKWMHGASTEKLLMLNVILASYVTTKSRVSNQGIHPHRRSGLRFRVGFDPPRCCQYFRCERSYRQLVFF